VARTLGSRACKRSKTFMRTLQCGVSRSSPGRAELAARPVAAATALPTSAPLAPAQPLQPLPRPLTAPPTPVPSPQLLRDGQYFTASASTALAPPPAASGPDDPWASSAPSAPTAAAAPAAAPHGSVEPSWRWPPLLAGCVAGGLRSRPAAMAALGGMLTFLKAGHERDEGGQCKKYHTC
jgi:hypothetical protein